ncbi:MAG: hypothetical protein GF334_10260 [Candidatus Altiarchaeales archaeon]|nr:hypothetical protein [Candidatus Altiarchaeales archaeon]
MASIREDSINVGGYSFVFKRIERDEGEGKRTYYWDMGTLEISEYGKKEMLAEIKINSEDLENLHELFDPEE